MKHKTQIRNFLKITTIFAAALALLALTPAPELRLGAIVSLTGPAGEQGKNWLAGAQLAVSELQTQGKKIALVVEDDETKPAKVASAFKKLVTADKVVGMVGGTWDFLGEVAYPLAAQFKLPFITPTNPSELLSAGAKANQFIFTNGLGLEADKVAIREFLKKKNIHSMIVVEPNIPWGASHSKMMSELAAELGITIVDQPSFAYEGYPDVLKTLALRISKKPADLVFAPIDYNGVDIFLREFAKLKLSPVFLTTQHLDQAFLLSSDPALYSRSYAVYPKVVDPGFNSRFKAELGYDPRVFASHGYDAVFALVKLIESGIDLSKGDARLEFQGVLGSYRIPAVNREIVRNQAVIMTTEHGRFEEWSLGDTSATSN